MFHPFYVKDESKETLGNWVAASNLKKGDELLTEDGKNIKVSEVRVQKFDEEITVYNLEITEVHTYYVAGGELVHNACADADAGGSRKNTGEGGSGSDDILDWSITKRRTGETRYEHVKLHEVNDLSKESHGGFYGDSVNTINKFSSWQ